MARDFKALLSKNMDSVERPKPLPAGHYYGKLGKYTLDDRNRNNTPYVRYAITPTSAGEDIDQDELSQSLNGKSLSEKNFRKDFYLTDDADYRLKEFLESLGLTVSGRSFNETIPEAPGADIYFELTLDPLQDGSGYINNVGTCVGVASMKPQGE